MTSPTAELESRVTHPVFNRAVVPVAIDENTLHLRIGPFSGPVYTVTDDEESGLITDVPGFLDGTRTVREILERFPPEHREGVSELLLQLVEKNLVYDVNRLEHGRRWPYLALQPEFTETNRKLCESTELLVIGTGDIGHHIAADALEMGVRRVRYVAGTDDASPPSTDDDRLSVSRDLPDAFADADVAVYAADGPYNALSRRINEISHEVGTPWMLAQRIGFDGIIGPTVFPGETSCYNCLTERVFGNLGDPEYYRQFTEIVDERSDLSTMAMPPLSRLVAGYATLDLLHLLSYGQAFTVEKAVFINGFDLSVEVNDVLKLPRCDVCGKEPGDDVKRFVESTATTDRF